MSVFVLVFFVVVVDVGFSGASAGVGLVSSLLRMVWTVYRVCSVLRAAAVAVAHIRAYQEPSAISWRPVHVQYVRKYVYARYS